MKDDLILVAIIVVVVSQIYTVRTIANINKTIAAIMERIGMPKSG